MTIPALARQTQPIAESLAQIAASWPTLLADTYALPAAAGSGMPGGSGETTLPGGGSRLSLIAETRHLLAHWCHVVLDERESVLVDLREPLDATDVAAMCHWLRGHAEWVEGRYALGPDWSGQPAAAEFEVLASCVHGATQLASALRPSIGPCQVQDCQGTIRGYIDSDHPENADLLCDADPEHRWERGKWVDLSKQLGHDYKVRMSTEELAEYLTMRFRRPIRPDNLHKWTKRYSIGLHRDKAGLWDRVEVTKWYLQWREQRVGA